MKILHICNGFTKQKLYNCFFSELSSFKINQTVYVPVYKNNSTIEYTFNNNL